MFNVELKFTCDSLKNWFAAEIKSVEIDEDLKDDFLKNNTPKTCQICDFPLDPFLTVDGLNSSAEYLYLENIFEKKDLFRMGVNDFEGFFTKVKKVMDCLDEFCSNIESQNLKNINSGEDIGEIEQIVQQIQNTCTYKGDTTKEWTKSDNWLLVQKKYRFFTERKHRFQMSYI